MIQQTLKPLMFRFTSEASNYHKTLIETSLPFVHQYGWSDAAIHQGCQKLGLSPASHRLITPYDMITYCMRKWNKTSLRIVDDENFGQAKRIKDKIHFSIKTRLQQELEFVDTWNQAMKIGAHPSNILSTKELLENYSNEIWIRCGDKSTDINYITKRILFNAAYAATELHLLTDQSPGKEESWRFLDRRLENILFVGKGLGDLKVVGEAAIDGVWNLMGGIVNASKRDIGRERKEEKGKKVETSFENHDHQK